MYTKGKLIHLLATNNEAFSGPTVINKGESDEDLPAKSSLFIKQADNPHNSFISCSQEGNNEAFSPPAVINEDECDEDCPAQSSLSNKQTDNPNNSFINPSCSPQERKNEAFSPPVVIIEDESNEDWPAQSSLLIKQADNSHNRFINSFCSQERKNEALSTPAVINEDESDEDWPTQPSFLNKQADNLHNEGLSPATMSLLLGPEANNRTFTHKLPKSASFLLSDDQWIQLSKNTNGHSFRKNTWQQCITSGIKLSNKYCVFAFKRHYVSCSLKRKLRRNAYLFKITGKCTFSNCPVKVHINGRQNREVEVIYNGNVNHEINECHSRKFVGLHRTQIKNKFALGQQPFKEFLNRLQETNDDILLSGNFSDFGLTKSTFQKISSESRQEGREDNNLINSIQKLISTFIDESKHNNKIKGFIQNFGVNPFYLHLFNENSIRIWHDFCTNKVVYIDATGNLVHSLDNKKEFLYYEVVFRNPIEKNAAIPIAGLLTDSQTEPRISDFLQSFRHAEKRLFGHANLSQPRQFNVDISWAIINSILRTFNNENLNDYIHRCWAIVSGKGKAHDLSKSFIHLCLSHVMKAFKRKLMTIYKNNFHFGMYALSLLANVTSIDELKEQIYDLIVILMSKNITETVMISVNRMEKKINDFDVRTSAEISWYNDKDTCLSTDVQEDTRMSTEEDYLLLTLQSPFKRLTEEFIVQIQDKINVDTLVFCAEGKQYNLEENSRYSIPLLDYLKNYYFNILPLWTGLLCGDITRHEKSYSEYVSHDVSVISNTLDNRTSGAIEQRFNFLKNIYMPKLKKCRIDTFCYALNTNYAAMHKHAALLSIKKRKQRVCKSGTETLTETWGKKMTTCTNQLSLGKYQKAPYKYVSVLRVKKKKKENKETMYKANIKTTNITKPIKKLETEQDIDIATVYNDNTNIGLQTNNTTFNNSKEQHDETTFKNVTEQNDKQLLKGPAWGGIIEHNGRKIKLLNTCTIDNFIYILSLLKNINKDLFASVREHCEQCSILYEMCCHGQMSDWNKAKQIWLTKICCLGKTSSNALSNVWNIFGTEYEYSIKYLKCLTSHSIIVKCSNPNCAEIIRKGTEIVLK